MRDRPALALVLVPVLVFSTSGWAQEPDGPTQIARGMEPAWSPDGRWILMSVLEDEQRDLFMVRPDSSGLRRVTRTPESELLPTWAPHGAVAYVRPGEDGLDLMVEDDLLEGDWRPRPVAPPGLVPAFTAAPWSPDGTALAVVGGPYPEVDIHRVPPDGSVAIPLVTGAGYDGSPAWSPDGRLAFASNREGSRDIWIRDPAGAVRRLTGEPGTEDAPTWSPDGSWIAFVSDRSGSREIHAVPASGGSVIRLTDHEERCGYPAWSPDGTRLVYTRVTRGRGNDRVMILSLPTELRSR